MIINNSNVKRLFIAISNNEIVFIATNLKDFISGMKNIDEGVKSKTYYDNHFKKNEIFYYQNPITGKQYTFQKIENDKS